jgi:hypothetical protein
MSGRAEPEPVLFRPVSRIRSPILERRALEPRRAGDPERPAVTLPPLRHMARPVSWAILPAMPMLLWVGWAPAIIVGTVVVVLRELHIRFDRSAISFGEGFLPYRAQDGWPHGVQEEDEVRWDWSPRAIQARPARVTD